MVITIHVGSLKSECSCHLIKYIIDGINSIHDIDLIIIIRVTFQYRQDLYLARCLHLTSIL